MERPHLLAGFSLRQLVLALVFIGTVGLEIELPLLRHAESVSQWIPHITLLIGLIVTIMVFLKPRAGTLRVFQAVMCLFIVIGLLGLYFHYKGNVEFATERDPSLTGLRLFWKALRGATPALAPGALSQLGLLGLIYSYRHPALLRDSIQTESAE
ncbi:MAG TPA: hypothetical protein VJ865_01885 [Gemmatimonadaceae bacterium]|nr:hypothetical protein [Gemmatimonadaceae bacterium]